MLTKHNCCHGEHSRLSQQQRTGAKYSQGLPRNSVQEPIKSCSQNSEKHRYPVSRQIKPNGEFRKQSHKQMEQEGSMVPGDVTKAVQFILTWVDIWRQLSDYSALASQHLHCSGSSNMEDADQPCEELKA
ncbi:hypothetical protein TREES_T100010978 [Tupaia chinensis]|uniref:Uncharacterized protein n=1 Tax=Tupaia chinensis TaxID=246437 RepID=L9JFH4_TUPCH|nr:hypothetical protein TREES_T100010978 [Tupaia chinensis]